MAGAPTRRLPGLISSFARSPWGGLQGLLGSQVNAWLPSAPSHLPYQPPAHPSIPQACPHSLELTRGFAAKGAADSGKQRKRRRGYTRLWSCRNERVRAQYEQIWPTQQLTPEELQLFRRNSRVFVTDLSRSISLESKIAAARGTSTQKLPHQDLRPLLYESDIHLDAVGEHPRYLRLRRVRAGNYGIKLQSLRKLRLLLGFVRRHHLLRLYETSRVNSGPDRVWKLISAMESTLQVTALRMGLAHDAIAALQMLERGMFYVNGVKPPMPRAMFVQPGDVVSINPWAQEWQWKYYTAQMGRRLVEQAQQGFEGQTALTAR